MKTLKYLLASFVIIFLGCNEDINKQSISKKDLNDFKSTLFVLQKEFKSPMLDFQFVIKDTNNLEITLIDSSHVILPEVTMFLFAYVNYALTIEYDDLLQNQNISFVRLQNNYEKNSFTSKFSTVDRNNRIESISNNPRVISTMKFFFEHFSDNHINATQGVLDAFKEQFNWFNFEGTFMQLLVSTLDDCSPKETEEYFAPIIELYGTDKKQMAFYIPLLEVWKRCGKKIEELDGRIKLLKEKYSEK